MNKIIKNTQALNINPVTLMDVLYGQHYFFLNKDYGLTGERIVLASRYGHAGSGTLPGMAAVLVNVDKVEKIKPALYRYTLSDIDVFEPFKTNNREPIFTISEKELNLLEDTNDIDWLVKYFNPYVKNAYINYKGEWVIPEPTYL